MRRRTWMDVGIAVLGLFLVCSAVQDVAQDPYGSGASPSTTGTGGSGQGDTGQAGVAQGTGDTGQGDTGQATGTQQPTNVEAVQRQEISQLRAEVERLQGELARTREQRAEAESPTRSGTGAGTGGTGNAEGGGPPVEAPPRQSEPGDSSDEGMGGSGRAGGAQASRPDTSNEGLAVANVIYTGRIRSLSQQQLVLDIEGDNPDALPLPLARDVRVFRGRQQVALKTLREGTLVRASADLYVRGNPVVRIEVLPTNSREAPPK